jgi:methionine biosynthesis protein MetW
MQLIPFRNKIRSLLQLSRELKRDLTRTMTQKDWEFPEMFEDYEKYHASINTGKSVRYDLINKWIDPNSTVLDVGVGDGHMAELLMNNKNALVKGIDISHLACEKAKNRGISVTVKDINNGLSLDRDEYYDYILLIEVIEHTIYPQKILVEAISHARKGVIVTIPNSAYLKWRIQLLRGYSPRQSFSHLHFWSVKDFRLFCKKLDINIVDFNTLLPPWLIKFSNLLGWQQCWLLAPKPYSNGV